MQTLSIHCNVGGNFLKFVALYKEWAAEYTISVEVGDVTPHTPLICQAIEKF